jgi:hypothetical protein
MKKDDADMTEPELTDAVIEAAMLRAEKAGCRPDDPRCYGFPMGVEEALARCTSAGWCLIGFVVGGGGRLRWDAWFNVETGAGRLRQPRE